MKRDFLRGLQLREAVVDKIMAEYGKDIEAYKQAGEAAKQEAEDWRKKYHAREEQTAREREQQAFEAALHSQLQRAGAKSVKAAEALLNLDGLYLEEGEIQGLEEQISVLRQDHSYLFASQGEVPPRAAASAKGGSDEQRSLFSVIRSAAGL